MTVTADLDARHDHASALPKLTYSVEETMQVLSISRSTLYKLEKSGALAGVRIGRRLFFRADDLTAYVAGL